MPAYDRFHAAVRNALVKDGWTITDDPLHLKYGADDLFVDLGAERVIAAEQGPRKIAVEIDMFTGPSEMTNLHNAVGQFVVYRTVLSKTEPGRELYLAVSEDVFAAVFGDSVGALLLDQQVTRLMAFDPEREEIIRWIPETVTAKN